MSIKVGNIELYMGPKQLNAPDDLNSVIVDFIKKTEKRLYVAIQEIDSQDIAEALIEARKRKVLVKIVIEQDYLRQSPARKYPFKPGGGTEENRKLHDAILRTNIDVKVDYNTSIFHQKFMVRDGQSVLTGSTNFTKTGTSANLNHVIIIHDENIAKIYSREFREIQKGHFGKLNEGHDPYPPQAIVSNVPVRVLFAPDHSPEMEIMKQMLKARHRIDFAIFTFSKSSGIDDTMIVRAQGGIAIRGIMDGMMANQKWAATHPVHKAGAKLYTVRKSNTLNKLHHKLMVLDSRVIIAGSFNYTGPANMLNDENIIMIGNFNDASAQSLKRQKKLGEFCKAEIERIIKTFGKKVT